MKRPITKREGEVLLFIKEYDKLNQVKPSRRDIAEHFGFSSQNAAADNVESLVRKGYLQVLSKVARGIIITPKGKKYK